MFIKGERIEGVKREEALVLVFCGPHESNQIFSPRPHRLVTGIVLAQVNGLRMVVAGDAWGGRDLKLSLDRAAEAGVDAKGAYDAQARTIADVQSVIRLITETPDYRTIEFVIVVTDWWHMDRAIAMLEGEWEKHPASQSRPLIFEQKPVLTCPTPSPEQLEAEIRGRGDYLAGRPYDPVIGDWTGKPIPTRKHSPEGDVNEGS